ncbi:MAG: GGDEF domain-containing protein [Proteobacteria bacterium]|nr:GGDEF domain-containing protein [Pseudomonadota bacterium]
MAQTAKQAGKPQTREWTVTFAPVNENESMKIQPRDELPASDAATRQARLAEKLQVLGISDEEMTPQVVFAVSALLEKLDDLSRELSRTKENLAEIERLVDVDCLAPIPNRRAFMRRLSWAITMHERYAHPSTVLYFDINDFKQINDQYGHSAGDLAIRHVAQLLAATMRESDFLARIGGDEFAVIMYYATEEAARKRGAKIAEKLAKTPFAFNGKQIVVTAAFGCYTVRSGDDADTCLAAADMSMYVDKRRSKAKVLQTL